MPSRSTTQIVTSIKLLSLQHLISIILKKYILRKKKSTFLLCWKFRANNQQTRKQNLWPPPSIISLADVGRPHSWSGVSAASNTSHCFFFYFPQSLGFPTVLFVSVYFVFLKTIPVNGVSCLSTVFSILVIPIKYSIIERLLLNSFLSLSLFFLPIFKYLFKI